MTEQLTQRTPRRFGRAWATVLAVGAVLGLVATSASAIAKAPAAPAEAAPTVTAVSAQTGPTAGDSVLVLIGTGFDGASGVVFGSLTSTTFNIEPETNNQQLVVHTPAHSAGRVYVTVRTDHGTSTYTAAATYSYVANPPALKHTGAAKTAPAITYNRVGAVAVSCASATFCAAGGSRSISTFNGSTWSAARPLGGQPITAVSCPVNGFCAAATSDGSLWQLSAGVWKKGYTADGAQRQVSCASATLCAATSSRNSTVTTFNGSNWTPATPFRSDYPDGPLAVSCFGNQCMVTGGSPYGYSRFVGGAWQPVQPLVGPATLYTLDLTSPLSCTSVTFCSFGTNRTGYTLFTGTAWSPAGQFAKAFNFAGAVDDIECVSSTYCVLRWTQPNNGAILPPRNWYVANGDAHTAVSVAADADISCWAAAKCLVLSPRSYYVTN